MVTISRFTRQLVVKKFNDVLAFFYTHEELLDALGDFGARRLFIRDGVVLALDLVHDVREFKCLECYYDHYTIVLLLCRNRFRVTWKYRGRAGSSKMSSTISWLASFRPVVMGGVTSSLMG